MLKILDRNFGWRWNGKVSFYSLWLEYLGLPLVIWRWSALTGSIGLTESGHSIWTNRFTAFFSLAASLEKNSLVSDQSVWRNERYPGDSHGPFKLFLLKSNGSQKLKLADWEKWERLIEGERDRMTAWLTHRQTDRQADRQMDRQTDRQTDWLTDRHIKTNGEIDRLDTDN